MLYPKATKTGLIKMLREMGHDIPNAKSAVLQRLRYLL